MSPEPSFGKHWDKAKQKLRDLRPQLTRSSRKDNNTSTSTSFPSADETSIQTNLLVSSAIERLLSTNDPPTESEEWLIRESLMKTLAETQRLRRSLRDNQRHIDKSVVSSIIEKEKEALKEQKHFVQVRRRILSPIRRLPPEVLCEIFEWYACWQQEAFQNPRRVRFRDLPWKLSHVCRYWRETTLWVPSLWNHLPSADLSIQDPLRLRRHYGIFSELLQRSRNSLLTVDISSPLINDDHPPLVLDLLMSHSESWGRVCIDAPVGAVAKMGAIKNRLTSLSRLKLILWSSERNSEPNLERLDIFEDAPKLKELLVLGEYRGELVFPSQCLVRYQYEISRCKTRLIGDAKALRELIIHDREHSTCAWVNSQKTFPAVAKFSYKRSWFHTESAFLNHVVLPALEELLVETSFRSGTGTLSTMWSMLLRSPTPSRLRILHLDVGFVINSHCTLADILLCTPALIELRTTVPLLSDLRALARSEFSTVLVPHLESCTFFARSPLDASSGRAIFDIGTFRCDQETHTMQGDVSFVSRLAKLRVEGSTYTELQCASGDIKFRVQQSYHSLLENSSSTSITNKHLQKLRAELFAEFRPDAHNATRICNVLHRIVCAKINVAQEMFLCDLPNIMNQIESSFGPMQRSATFGNVLKYINNIRAHWESYLLECPSEQLEDIHWAVEGGSFDCLTYIVKDHIRRESRETFVKSLIYGF
ncbi:hypothetical protein BDN70DRAFT_994286 [Pholiota conissans]|uniref:F-box domain-containing protein n=1 Tax=Pholiota conissans TaxID=109636 RepID=A0A9P5Z161_9AGAR|nr:hypothetical protein BDN70DRAFT_994286 [Pholiota conissans]